MVTISKFKEGEKIWSRQSKSGRSAIDIFIRMRDRLDRLGFFVEETSRNKAVYIIVGAGDNCLKFSEV
jgi:DNA polymerase II small subunit/DNA polymerase delta subunit B